MGGGLPVNPNVEQRMLGVWVEKKLNSAFTSFPDS